MTVYRVIEGIRSVIGPLQSGGTWESRAHLFPRIRRLNVLIASRIGGFDGGRRQGLPHALQSGANVVGNVVHHPRDVNSGFAALKAGSLGEAVISTAVHRAVDMFGMPLLVLQALKTVLRNDLQQLRLKICRITAVCFSFERSANNLSRCPVAWIAGGTGYDVSVLQSAGAR